MFGFTPQCPDVKGAIVDKLNKVFLLLPAWVEFIFRWILRFFLVIQVAIFTVILWIVDIFFQIHIAIRNFFWYVIIQPIVLFIKWCIDVWIFIW